MATAASAITSVAKALNVVAEWGAENPKSAMAAGAGAAGLGFAGAGYMSYKLMTGFGLGTSATALTGSAAALDASAAALMRASAAHGVPGAGGAAGAGASAGASAAGASGAAAEAAARREAVRVTSTGGASVAAEGAGLGARLGRAAASALSLAGRGLRFGSGVATPLLMLRDIGEAAHPMNPESAAARVPGIAGVVNGRRTDPLDPGVLERARRSQVEMNHGFGFEAKRARDNEERVRARQLADDEVLATLTRAPGVRSTAPGSGLRGFGLSGPQAGKAAPGTATPLVDTSSLQGANAEARRLTEALGAVEMPRKLALDGSALREVERDIDRVTAKFSALMGLAGAAPG